jgi:two-component system nitrate/nitrite response regulator NarL
MTAAIRVLIVDDHAMLRDGVAANLRRDPGIEVVGEAATADDAIALALAVRPDVVLMDLQLPRSAGAGVDPQQPAVGGIEATRRLCAELPEARVLILSAHDQAYLVAEAVQAGACGYILKGIEKGERLPAIVRVLQEGGRHFGAGVPLPGTRAPAPDPRALLSAREIEVLCLVVAGKTSKEIGRALGISQRTADKHRANIRDKLAIDRVPALIRYAATHGLCAAAPAGGGE